MNALNLVFEMPLAIGMPGLPEMIIIACVLLLLFGTRLPGVMRSMGRGVVEFKRGLSGEDDDAVVHNDETPKTESKA